MQSEIKKLNDEFDAYKAECLGAKVRFVKMAKKFTSNVPDRTHIEIPSAEASAQPTKEHASTTDENQAVDETASTRADEEIPVAEETARATTSVAPKEQVRSAEESKAALEEIA